MELTARHDQERHTLHRFLRGRPWGLRTDGDIWAAAAELIQRKGPHSIRVIWTKGHATEEDVAKGVCSEEYRRANGVADGFAEAAHELHPKEVTVAHQHARLRWRTAQRVVRAVHAFLREALAERDALRRMKTSDIDKTQDCCGKAL